jgi:hypothetical protein
LTPFSCYEVRGASAERARKEGGLMKSVMGLLLGLGLVVPAVSFAADLTAEQIVAKVSQTYCGLRSFRFVEHRESRNPILPNIRTSAPPGPFGNRPADYETDLTVSTRGKIRLVVRSWDGEVWLVSDGRKTWAYIPNLNEYAEAAAAPSLQELWRHPVNLITDDLARYRRLSQETRRAKLRGEESLSLGGQQVRCYVVGVPSPIGWRALWVDEQRYIVLRDEWFSPMGSGGGPDPESTVIPYSGVWTSRLTKADLGPISDDAFRFAVPSGARRVDLFSAAAEPRKFNVELVLCLLIGSEVRRDAFVVGQYSAY